MTNDDTRIPETVSSDDVGLAESGPLSTAGAQYCLSILITLVLTLALGGWFYVAHERGTLSALATAGWGTLLGAGVGAMMASEHPIPRRRFAKPIQGAAAVVWFLPLIFAVRLNEGWAAPIAAIVGMGIARQAWTATSGVARRDGPNPRWAATLGFGVFVQGGLVALIADQPRLAAALWGLASISILWRWRKDRWTRGEAPPLGARWKNATSILLASVFTFLLAARGGAGDREGVGRSGAANAASEENAPGVNGPQGPGYTGVILIPNVKPHQVQVPRLTSLTFGSGVALRKPLTIPFDGVYWYLYPPAFEPPPRTVTQKGTPLETWFRSVNRIPLMSTARQTLDPPIDLGTLRGIEMVVFSAEAPGRTIRASLILGNSKLPVRTASIYMTGDLAPGTPGSPYGSVPASSARETTFEFRVPPRSAIEAFDEMRVQLWVDEPLRSVRASIDRFVLLPR